MYISHCFYLNWSGWSDSNRRPPAPKAGALAGLRHTPIHHRKIEHRLNNRNSCARRLCLPQFCLSVSPLQVGGDQCGMRGACLQIGKSNCSGERFADLKKQAKNSYRRCGCAMLVDRIAQLAGFAAGGVGEVFAARGIEDTARGVDYEAAAGGVLTVAHGRF